AARIDTEDATSGSLFPAVPHFLPAVIDTYRERHPKVLVRIIEDGADGVFASVKHGEAGFGVHSIGMPEHDVDFTPLLKDPYVLACRADHALGARRTVRWDELAAW